MGWPTSWMRQALGLVALAAMNGCAHSAHLLPPASEPARVAIPVQSGPPLARGPGWIDTQPAERSIAGGSQQREDAPAGALASNARQDGTVRRTSATGTDDPAFATDDAGSSPIGTSAGPSPPPRVARAGTAGWPDEESAQLRPGSRGTAARGPAEPLGFADAETRARAQAGDNPVVIEVPVLPPRDVIDGPSPARANANPNANVDAEGEQPPAEERARSAVGPLAASNGFAEDVRLGQAPRIVPAPGRPRSARTGGSAVNDEDTNLDRPRAERAGEGGGPTRVAEDDDDDEDFPKSNLLVRALGLQDSPVKAFGWLEGSFTGNPSRPINGENFGVFPNNHANAWMFNQIYFVLERRVDPDDENDWDYGYRIDNMLGADWQVSHAFGLFDHAFVANRFGYDIPQIYGELHLPVLTPGGVDFKLGRWYALPGYEDLPAPSRPLLSTTYMFSYAQPITQLGLMSTWHVTDQINLYNGVTNGWDRWFGIHNKPGYAGGAAWDSKDGRTNVTLTFNWGPNQLRGFLPGSASEVPVAVTQPPFLAGRRNLAFNGSAATLFTAVATHEFTEDLSGIFETNLGYENNVAGAGRDGTTQNASWYGLAGWLLYDFRDNLTGVVRSEVFRDNNGILTGFADNFYETTLGVIYRPRPWFWTRPEIRYDWAQSTRPFDAGTSKHQLTLGFDVIFLF